MIFRRLRPEDYEHLTQHLNQTAETSPLDASHTVVMTVNDWEYRLKLQLCNKNRIAALQSLKFRPSAYDSCLELITDNLALSALLELYLLQSKPPKHTIACERLLIL